MAFLHNHVTTKLWKDLHETCEWGTGERWGENPTDTGMSRLTLSDADKSARDWFVSTTKSLGCKIKIDAMGIFPPLTYSPDTPSLTATFPGNTFAIRPGKKDAPPTYAGSHLDTQPTGGRYDGILGVHAGIEALKTMNDMDIETEYPTGVINVSYLLEKLDRLPVTHSEPDIINSPTEEGARFPISMVSSGVWAGAIPLSTAYDLVEVGGGKATQKSELERIGYLGQISASYKDNPIGAHFELHIEQGPILESSGGKIGAVKGVNAFRWFIITVKGRDCHTVCKFGDQTDSRITGTTDFKNRSDAMLTAAKLILHSHNKATEMGCLASTGFVQFSLDIRCLEDSRLREIEQALKEDFNRIAAGEDFETLGCKGTTGKGCTVDWKLDTDSAATHFDEDCIRCVEQSAGDMLGTNAHANACQRMISGAGHDSPEDCGNGAQVLLGAMLRYDRLRAEKGA
ncbi:hypothetical protein CJF30_00000097 [Rutstroemia sp. NJR-2017a BBW]|nr:hypothetical protein CJF30_00000097 [Rutstroemia sp. NJR-2017a BBW]